MLTSSGASGTAPAAVPGNAVSVSPETAHCTPDGMAKTSALPLRSRPWKFTSQRWAGTAPAAFPENEVFAPGAGHPAIKLVILSTLASAKANVPSIKRTICVTYHTTAAPLAKVSRIR